MTAINLVNGRNVVVDSKEPDSSNGLGETLAKGILAAGEVGPLISDIANGVVKIKLVDPCRDSVSFTDRFKVLIEVLNEKFPGADLSFTEEQIACFESLSKLPLYEIRPVVETVAVSLYQDFKKIEQHIKHDLGWPDNKVNMVLGMLAQLQKTHAPYGWIENNIELDEGDSEMTEVSEGLEEDVIPVLEKMEKCVSSISKSFPQNSDAMDIAQAIKLKISIMRSMIKLGRNDSGKIFWLVLGEAYEQVEEKLKARFPILKVESTPLSGIISSALIKEEYERSIYKIPEDERFQYLSDLIEWQIPAFEDSPSITATFKEIQKQCNAQPRNFESIKKSMKKAIAKWQSQLEDLGRKIDKAPSFGQNPVFNLFDQRGMVAYLKNVRDERAECLIKKAKNLLIAMQFGVSYDLIAGDEEIRGIKFVSTLQSFLCLIEKLKENSDKDLYSDFNQLVHEMFLNGSPGFLEKAQNCFEKNGLLSHVDFCHKANYYFAKPSFLSKLALIHRKYSQIASRMDEPQATQLKKDYSNLCLEFANLFLFLKMIDREKSKDYSELNLDAFLKSIPKQFLDYIQLETLLEEEVTKPSEPENEDRLLKPTEAPVMQVEKRGPKVKTRGQSNQVAVVQQEVLQPPKLNAEMPSLPFPKRGTIRRDAALRMLKDYFGSIAVFEGADHSDVRVGGGGSVYVPRHTVLSAKTVHEAAKKAIEKQMEMKKD